MKSVAQLDSRKIALLVAHMEYHHIHGEVRRGHDGNGLEICELLVNDADFEKACDLAETWFDNMVDESVERARTHCPLCGKPHPKRIEQDGPETIHTCQHCGGAFTISNPQANSQTEFQSIAYESFREVLNTMKPEWVLTEKGLAGPGGALVRMHGSSSQDRIDVQFEPDIGEPLKTPLWDNVAGFGSSLAEKAGTAAQLWAQTTAAAFLEWKYSRRGEFATHYRGSDPEGFKGWHAIGSAVLPYGGRDDRLLQWYVNNPVLPALSQVMSESIDERRCPHGVKIFLGGKGIAEVQLDGEIHEAASAALAKLAWPRVEPIVYLRCYVLVLHRDKESAQAR